MSNYVGYRYDGVSDSLAPFFDITVDSFYSDEYDPGEITEQSIPAGTEYDPTRKHKLTLKVCQGSEYAYIPDYSGYTQESYLKELGDRRIKYNVVETENSAAKGTIVKLSKAPGDRVNVKNGEELVVYVSTGEKETSIVTTLDTQTQTSPTETSEPTETQTSAPEEEPAEEQPDDEQQDQEQENPEE